MTLLRDIEATDWSEDGHALFQSLAQFGPTDEGALIVITAAARLLAITAMHQGDLQALACEFGAVADKWFAQTDRRPFLRLVGGKDAC